MFLAQSHHAVSIHSTVDVGRERGCRDDRRVEVRHRDVEIKQRRSTIYHADQWSSTFPHVVFSRFVIRSCKARYTLATTSTVADTVDYVADTVHSVARVRDQSNTVDFVDFDRAEFNFVASVYRA